MRYPNLVLALIPIFLLGTSLWAGERLVLIGGGNYPEKAIRRFVDWSGGEGGRILVITWATETPDAHYQSFLADFSITAHGATDQSPAFSEMGTMKQKFLTQLANATGVFFTGGDQNRIMDVVGEHGLVSVLQDRFKKGVVFGGTSAGTAVMSQTMLTGEGDFTCIDPLKVGTRDGLGLLREVVLDQHFLKRMRANRLMSVVFSSREPLGMGIDESTAVAVEDNRYAEVIGPHPVLIMDNTAQAGKLTLDLLPPGQHYDLVDRKKIEARTN